MNQWIATLLLSLATSSLLAATPSDTNLSAKERNVTVPTQQELAKQQQELEKKRRYEQKRNATIRELRNNIALSDKELERDSIWTKKYSSYLTYIAVKKDLVHLQEKIDKLTKSGESIEDSDTIDSLLAKKKLLTDQIELLKGHGKTPFASLLQPEEIEEYPKIENPIEIFSGLSFIKRMHEMYASYVNREDEMRTLIVHLRNKVKNYEKLSQLDALKSPEEQQAYRAAKKQLKKFERTLETLELTDELYKKRIEAIEVEINKDIETQLVELANIVTVIVVLLIIFFLAKLVARKYLVDNERFYMINKVINFINFLLIFFVLLFAYIDNASYIVTVLGFASAGIAIAMKDWFMSILGWMVIVLGGSIHTGDRVRVDKDGMLYVGDVLDISLLRITILEDITLTTYKHNRRAGRIIFIPNNYVFTSMIANYSHASLKTVWDGIDITITFDSNHKKALHIAKEITRKYSKGYTDITRKQLNKLRNQYNLKNTNVEPRIFSFIEPNGVQISSWYLTNAYATLTLRSTISTEILDAFLAESDITIAYPTQKLYLSNSDKDLHMGEVETL
ncbi:MAG: mechanosensitive ion channel family protein [Sulfurimonas sp.]|nr:MAG: mechanosensitive ion channel family protein [Sulfurimonas sp.]